jgi:anti-sigma-K factor RskA
MVSNARSVRVAMQPADWQSSRRGWSSNCSKQRRHTTDVWNQQRVWHDRLAFSVVNVVSAVLVCVMTVNAQCHALSSIGLRLGSSLSTVYQTLKSSVRREIELMDP